MEDTNPSEGYVSKDICHKNVPNQNMQIYPLWWKNIAVKSSLAVEMHEFDTFSWSLHRIIWYVDTRVDSSLSNQPFQDYSESYTILSY